MTGQPISCHGVDHQNYNIVGRCLFASCLLFISPFLRGAWTGSYKWSMHGPGPKWGSMDPGSMFCPHPNNDDDN